MIELPEAIVIAKQIDEKLKGKQISFGIRGSSPHKFAFIGKYSNQEFTDIIKNKTVGSVRAQGMLILINLEPDYALTLGCGGERIIFHLTQETLPKKHQLLLGFSDDTFLTVTVSGWGEVRLLGQREISSHPHIRKGAVSPLGEKFTFNYFNSLFDAEGKHVSAKYFIVSKPGIWGVGNGCLQDILYKSKIHPRRQMGSLKEEERRSLFESIRQTLREIVEFGGRDSERDLFDKAGGYHCLLNSKAVGLPCRNCGTLIEKIQYLGGSAYFCPSCQPE